MRKPRPPGRHQEQASKHSVALLDPLRSVQFSSKFCSSLDLIGHYFLSSIIVSCVGEVIGFRLFRATGLAFAIRPTFKVQFKAFLGASMHFGSTFLAWLRLMLVGIWLGLHFGHHFLSSIMMFKVQGYSRHVTSEFSNLNRPCNCKLYHVRAGKTNGWRWGSGAFRIGPRGVESKVPQLWAMCVPCSPPHWIKASQKECFFRLVWHGMAW